MSLLASTTLGATHPLTTKNYILSTFRLPEIDRIFRQGAGPGFSSDQNHFSLDSGYLGSAQALSSLKPQERQALAALAKKNGTGRENTSYSFSKRYSGGYELKKGAAVVRVTPVGRGRGEIEDSLLVYKNIDGRMDAVFAPVPGGVEELYLIKTGGKNKEEIETKITISNGAELKVNPQGELEAGGFVLSTPLVIDAAGKKVPGKYELKAARKTGRETSATLALSFDAAGLAYPLLIDPTWRTTGSMITPRCGHHAILLPNGKVLVVGNSFTCELFDPATGVWSPTGSLVSMRYGEDTATLLPNGKVLVAGGYTNNTPTGYTSSCEVYDPATGVWSPTGNMLTARANFTATLMSNGKVLVVAGEVNVHGNIFDPATYTNACEIYDPETGVWTAAAPLDERTRFHAATLLPNGQVLISGGTNDNGYLTTCRLYDPATDNWSWTGNLITPRCMQPAVLLPNGKVLVVGGFYGGPLSSCELYDPSTGVWTATGSLNNQRFDNIANLLPNGKVLTAGGYDYSTPGYTLKSAELYDPATGNWAVAGNMSDKRDQAAAVLLPGGQLLITGGYTNPSVVGSCDLYDPTTGNWGAAGSLHTTRYYHSATLLSNGQAMVVGGYNGNYINSCELYDPASNSWTVTGSLNTGRCYQTTTLLPNGKVLVAGGTTTFNIAYDACELYDPATGSWAPTGSMNTGRYAAAAILLSNGQVLVAGGEGQGNNQISSCELYDPASGHWTTTGSLNYARDWAPVTLLPNGKVLITGGSALSGTLGSCELYDPATGQWTMTGSLNTARWGHTATLLPNGKVLAAAGSSSTGCELYDPATGIWTTTGSLNYQRLLPTATLLPSGKVLVVGGWGGADALTSSELYDPATGIWTTAASLVTTTRWFHTATLLPNGYVLVEAGKGGAWTPLSSCELIRYTEYDYTTYPSMQPVITGLNGSSNFPAELGQSNSYTITGSGFQGLDDYPRVYLQLADSGGPAQPPSGNLLDVSSTVYQMSGVQWQNAGSSISFSAPGGLPSGYYQLTVRTGAVPSNAKMVYCNAAIPPANVTITSGADPHGFITPSGATSVAYGGSQSYTISAEAGYYILDVQVDGISLGPTYSYVFNNAMSSHVIYATIASGDAFTVINCNDSGPGSLRQCLLNANARPGRDTITFNIPDTDPGFIWGTIVQPHRIFGFWEISPQTPLPDITDSVAILGSTQSANQGNRNPYGPAVEIGGDGRFSGSHFSEWTGLNINGVNSNLADNCTIEGLTINNSSGEAGIFLTFNYHTGLPVSGCNIHDNYVGTDPSGTYGVGPNSNGIDIGQGSGNRIANNLAAGNLNCGICVGYGSSNEVVGNVVGLDQETIDEVNLANNIGIEVDGSNNIIGGDTTAEANFIMGNILAGIEIFSDGNVVKGNYIGTDAGAQLGTDAGGWLGSGNGGNGASGIDITGNNNTIGPNNVVAYNLLSGVDVSDGYDHNTITQNSIFGQGARLDIRLEGNANDNISPPLILTASLGGVTGEAPANSTVELFATGPSESDNGGWTSAAGAGGGWVYLGSVTADGSGLWSMNLPLTAGRRLTATATDQNGNTSQFAANIDVGAAARTFVVTTTADSGEGSLRQCINYANLVPGHDTIAFNIPDSLASYESGGHDWRIYPLSNLPALTESVDILGSTQAANRGYQNPNGPNIVLDGSMLPQRQHLGDDWLLWGLTLNTDHCAIEGLSFENFEDADIALYSTTEVNPDYSYNHIYNNHFSDYGVWIGSAGHNNLIGGPTPAEKNYFVSWGGVGVESYASDAGYNVIQGNYFHESDNKPISIVDSNYNSIVGNTIYSDYGSPGIEMAMACSNEVKGNYLASGTDIDGTGCGIVLDYDSNYNLIGGPTASERNVIENGIIISDSASNEVKGNYIGTDAGGTVARGTPWALGWTYPPMVGGYGIELLAGSSYNQIGGTLPGEGNLISGNIADGVYVYVWDNSSSGDFNGQHYVYVRDGKGNKIVGNIIGPAADGTTPLGNHADGIYVGQASNLTIGPNNIIAYNGGDGGSGVLVDDGANHVTITRNSMETNAALGIELRGSANDGIAAPVITNQWLAGGQTTLAGTAANNAVIEIFKTDATGDEGKTFLGSVEADGTGSWTATVGGLAQGDKTTATATLFDSNGGDTSQFSWSNLVMPKYIVYHASDSGAGSFRQCLLDANADAGRQTITFNIPNSEATYESGVYVWRIAPASALPVISGEVFVNGSSQPTDATYRNPNGPALELLGPGDGSFNGLTIQAANCAIEGLVINQFGDGIALDGPAANHNNIYNNYIGTDVNGAAAPLGNFGAGVQIDNGASYNTVGGGLTGGNVISGNTSGIWLANPGTSHNEISGNIIGLDKNGEALGNSMGLAIYDDARDNVIGGLTGDKRNIISGNFWAGLDIESVYGRNQITGNYIGTDSSGSAARGNTIGVYLWDVSSNIIGNGTAAGRNVISGNNNAGLLFDIILGGASPITGNQVLGNYIGLSAAGAPLGNGLAGVALDSNGTDDDAVKFNTISQNRIYDNGGLGIDLAGGVNQGVAPPTIASANLSVASGGAPAYSVVEVFATGIPDPAGSGEGLTYLGSATANGSGQWTMPLPLNDVTTLSATATDRYGNTSEFAVNYLAFNPNSTFEVTNTFDDDRPGTLRQMITYANTLPDFHTVRFNIPSGDPGYTMENGVSFWRIQPLSPLPPLTREGVVIDGTTQTANQGNTNPNGPEIELRGPGDGSFNGLTIQAANCAIEGLAINQFNDGIALDGPAANHNNIYNNYIGTDANGTAAPLENFGAGVLIDNGASYNTVGGGLTGGNVISGNGNGIGLANPGTSHNEISGNIIGLDRNGEALGNSIGLAINDDARDNVIGGLTGDKRNIISGNFWAGLDIESVYGRNQITGNYIGTDSSGSAARGNTIGIYLWDVSSNIIGDGTAAGRNVISGNIGAGLLFDIILGGASPITGNQVLGNYIGLSAAGAPLGNGLDGVSLNNSGSDGSAVKFNTISQNRIYDNGGLGIDLFGGVNQGIASPTIGFATLVSASGEAPAGSTVEVFATGVPDPAGSGEGRTYLGSATANGSGQWLLTFGTPLTGDTTISATATDTQGDTSMFSWNYVATPLIVPLSITREADTADRDVIVSWPTVATPDVYVLTGDGTGIYTNDISRWTKVTNTIPIDGFSVSGNQLHHAGQVGAGSGEAYYKAIRTGFGTDLLPLAEAVGKVNIFIKTYPPTMELIALPVVPDNGDMSSVIGAQFGAGTAEVWSRFNAPISGWGSQKYNGSHWYGSLPSGQMTKDRGYWIKSLTNDKMLTFVGRVTTTGENYSFNDETLFLYGNSYPQAVPWEASGLSTAFNTGDQIWQWDNGWQSKKYQGGNSWGGTTLSNLLFRHGFWISKHSAAGTWNFPKPY